MKRKNATIFLVISGLACGIVNGFFGGGGGMVIVPVLTALCGYPRKNAHATALAVMLPVSIASAIIYIVNGNCDLSVIIPVALGFTLGGLIGAKLLKKLSDKWVRYVFAFLILLSGVKLLFF